MSKVVVYSKHNCYGCQMTKRYLEDSGIEFTELNVQSADNGLDIIDELRAIGHKSFPVVLVDDDWTTSFNGFRPDRLALIKQTS